MIDFHTHFFSWPFFEALAKASPLPGSVEEKLARVAAKAGLELPSRDVGAHHARWSAELQRHGIDHCVSFASLPEEVPALVEARKLAAGRLSTFALVNPLVEGAGARTDALLDEHGFAGVLLFPAMHRFDPSGEECAAVLDAVARRQAVAVVHCGMLQVKLRDLLGLPRPYDFRFADPLRLVPAANRHRAARFVIPHFGAGMFRETLMVGSQCENVYVDTSSSNSWLATQVTKLTLVDVFARALDVFSEQRILFGTDSSTFPRGYRADLLLAQRQALEAAGGSDEALRAIFDGNARRLLQLP
jgi:predicted TIM-barrel fold metal-dependent hydrolase